MIRRIGRLDSVTVSHNYALYSIFYNKFPEPKLSRIRAEVAEHFCLFLTGAAVKMLSTQNCSRNISETMWLASSNGQRKKVCPSSTWKLMEVLVLVYGCTLVTSCQFLGCGRVR